MKILKQACKSTKYLNKVANYSFFSEFGMCL